MKIVIDIPKEDYEGIIGTKSYASKFNLVKAMKEAIILPKEHGRLIDESKIAVIIETEDGDDFITDAPTIIEADKKGDIYAD